MPDTGIISFQNKNLSKSNSIAVFGSTGSIGCSTLEIARRNNLEIFALVANSSVDLLAKQAQEFQPKYVGIANSEHAKKLASLLPKSCELVIGTELSTLAAQSDYDTMVAAIVGSACLSPVLSAIKANKKIALANKESLVSGGKLVLKALETSEATIIPVDSEHSACFQALQGAKSDVKRVILTASGGPFLNKTLAELQAVTPEQAVKHPNWSMGKKISVDSSTMMNKALEIIEAYWLFGTKAIDVVIHPQSIVHSLIEYSDNSQIAQLSVPDMKGAIAYALSYPESRFVDVMSQLDLAGVGRFDFFKPDTDRFPALKLARQVLEQPGLGAVFNMANEVAVELFLAGKLKYLSMFKLVESALDRFGEIEYNQLDDLIDLELQVKIFCSELNG